MQLRVNIRKLKQLVWLVCVLTFVYAGWTFFDIYTAKERGDYSARKGTVFEELLRKHVNDQARDRHPKGFYEQARYEALWTARTDGSRKPPPEQPKPTEVEAPKKVVEPLDTIVGISLVLYSVDPVERFVAITYLADARTAPEGKATRLHLSEGDPLMPPYDKEPYFGSVKSIGLQAVTFTWGEGETTLTPRLGTSGEDKPLDQFRVAERVDPTASITEAPDESIEVQPRVWVMGKRDLTRLREDPQRFMEEDINVRTITATGGGRTQIEITEVKQGSLAEKYGAKVGDRIISVNEIPMSSIAGAINWAKANPDLPEYRVVYERAGQQYTWTFHVKS